MNFNNNQSKEKVFREILQDLVKGESFDEAKLGPLFEQMVQVSGLIENLNSAATAEERAAIGERLLACGRECAPIVNEFLSQYGVSSEEAQAFFENPDHLSAKEWERVQEVQKNLETIRQETSPRTARQNRRRS